MYEDILKFLKSKNKKLTKEEANEFIRLLAESVGCDEEITIHSTIDNSDEEASTEINLVIDNLNIDSYSEDDSFSLDGLSDEDEEDKEYVLLNKRKIKRLKNFKRQRIDEISSETNKKKKTGNKIIEKSDRLKKENNLFRKADSSKNKNELNNDIEKLQKEKIKSANEHSFKEDEKIPFSLPKNLNISNCNFRVSENSEKSPFKLPQMNENKKFEFKLPQMNENKKFEFKLPKFDHQAQIENEEFKFDLGDLIDVNNNGPDYKFYDEENNEL
ncbi:hypothetical protein P3W45_000284 [Vairimorpha bombi]|jgi:hypothetical protein